MNQILVCEGVLGTLILSFSISLALLVGFKNVYVFLTQKNDSIEMFFFCLF